jgi:hypothetical protein
MEASQYFLEEKTEKICFKVSKETKELLDRWARKARLSTETMIGALMTEWAKSAGGVWHGVWSKGSRVILDWPLSGHFLILRVPKGVK